MLSAITFTIYTSHDKLNHTQRGTQCIVYCIFDSDLPRNGNEIAMMQATEMINNFSRCILLLCVYASSSSSFLNYFAKFRSIGNTRFDELFLLNVYYDL